MSQNDTEFYITIPNWSSEDYYHNTPGDFRVQLPHAVNLHGEWVVGLSQILYHQTWYNIESEKNVITINYDDIIHDIQITEGHYSNEGDLITEINRCVNAILPDSGILFQYNIFNTRCTVLIPHGNIVITLHTALSHVLGLPLVINNSQEGEKPINLNMHTQSIYVYCDIIDDQLVGGKSWKLLRFLPSEIKTFGRIIAETFDTPQYLPVKTKHFQCLHIKLCNQDTDVIKFTRGISVVQLHFKLARIPLFY
jgi:hypothetical protein